MGHKPSLIPEFAPTEHSFAGFHHSFVVPLVHVAHQLPVIQKYLIKKHPSDYIPQSLLYSF